MADSEPAEFEAAIRTVHGGAPWFPAEQTSEILGAVADDLDTTATEKRSRLTGVVLALIPLAGLIAAIQAGFWRRYFAQIGVRPVDIAVDPASRVIDAVTAMLLVVGVFGPLLFIGNWLDMLRESPLNSGPLARFLGWRKTAHVVASVLWLVVAALLARGPELGLVTIVGPVVAIAIIAKVLNANSALPRIIRIEGVTPGTAVVGGLVVLFAFVGILGYEVLIVGPDLHTDGEHGLLAPRVLGVNAQPIRAINVDDGSEAEMLYLGGNADLYVLVDPCDDDRVDYVSVGAHRLVVIDEVTCEPTG